jgi:hypothetical protein
MTAIEEHKQKTYRQSAEHYYTQEAKEMANYGYGNGFSARVFIPACKVKKNHPKTSLTKFNWTWEPVVLRTESP